MFARRVQFVPQVLARSMHGARQTEASNIKTLCLASRDRGQPGWRLNKRTTSELRICESAKESSRYDPVRDIRSCDTLTDIDTLTTCTWCNTKQPSGGLAVQRLDKMHFRYVQSRLGDVVSSKLLNPHTVRKFL